LLNAAASSIAIIWPAISLPLGGDRLDLCLEYRVGGVVAREKVATS
jgi:hypothetical protein